jgi:predicted RNA-binding protein (virulence factor B family)
VDGEGMLADMRIPQSKINEPVVMTAKDAAARGAFFDWGTTRDLYVPEKWQESPINPGMQYVVVPFIDEKSQRLLGCTKLKHFFPETSKWLQPKQAVSLTVFAKTQLGYKMLIDNAVLGLLFHSDVHVKLKIGETVSGTVKEIREDGKINLVLSPVSKDTRNQLHDAILQDLEAHDGISTLTDKSSPEDIYERFQVSKGAYKKALGHLFKAKKLVIEQGLIRLTR